MKNYKNITLKITEIQKTGRYYDPIEKKEAEGVIPEHGVVIGEVKEALVARRFRISKQNIIKYGEEILPSTNDEQPPLQREENKQ